MGFFWVFFQWLVPMSRHHVCVASGEVSMGSADSEGIVRGFSVVFTFGVLTGDEPFCDFSIFFL